MSVQIIEKYLVLLSTSTFSYSNDANQWFARRNPVCAVYQRALLP